MDSIRVNCADILWNERNRRFRLHEPSAYLYRGAETLRWVEDWEAAWDIEDCAMLREQNGEMSDEIEELRMLVSKRNLAYHDRKKRERAGLSG